MQDQFDTFRSDIEAQLTAIGDHMANLQTDLQQSRTESANQFNQLVALIQAQVTSSNIYSGRTFIRGRSVASRCDIVVLFCFLHQSDPELVYRSLGYRSYSTDCVIDLVSHARQE